ncbi:MAG: hypothetical protein KC776_12220 [Myxococcales bacterium]|nr:hypothetical protein [Myxococcales bacterium]MCB9583363.1 hypothetical protein [Polyangiaceae bacterium]
MRDGERAILEDLGGRIRARFGAEVRCVLTDRQLVVSLHRWPDASLVVTVTDLDRPYFGASYPARSRKRKGDFRDDDAYAPQVLDAAVFWMVSKLTKFGFVPDEMTERGW